MPGKGGKSSDKGDLWKGTQGRGRACSGILIQELRISLNGISAPCKGIDDPFERGLGLIKDHRGIIGGRLAVPIHGVIHDSFSRFEDKPYPVAGVSSPAAYSQRNFENHGLDWGGGGCDGLRHHQKKNCEKEEESDIFEPHRTSF